MKGLDGGPPRSIKSRRVKGHIMREITLEELLEAGCHFGHQVTRSNPKARDFIFEARDNIHIIDLAKTKEGLEESAAYLKRLAASGGSLIVVATKRQAKDIVESELKRVKGNGAKNLYSVTSRWVGGVLTNLSEVKKNFRKLHDLTRLLGDEMERSQYTKKELGGWDKERQKLEVLYGGIANLEKVPNALFIIDTHLEAIALDEARKTGVTSVGIVDTNADPDVVDYIIPANDDAVGSIQLITSYILDAWLEGQMEGEKAKETEKAKEKVSEVSSVSKVSEGETKKGGEKEKKTTSKEKKAAVKKAVPKAAVKKAGKPVDTSKANLEKAPKKIKNKPNNLVE